MWKWLRGKRATSPQSSADVQDAIQSWLSSGQSRSLQEAFKLGLSPTAVVHPKLGTPLHIAAQRDLMDALVLCYSYGGRDTCNTDGRQALHLACKHGHLQCCTYLLKNLGSDIDLKDAEGNTPLMLAIASDSLPVIRYLVSRGAEVISTENNAGNTAFHLCQSEACMRLILELTSVHIDLPNRDGQTLLLLAVERRSRTMVKAALGYGANVNARRTDDANALHIACAHGQAQLIPYLISAGCSTVDVDAAGLTPVECALVNQDADTAAAFYFAGAMFTRRQLLLLGILLRYAVLKQRLLDELAQQSSPTHAAASQSSPTATVVSTRSSDIDPASSYAHRVVAFLSRPPDQKRRCLAVTGGDVNLNKWQLDSTLAAELEKLIDPVPRPAHVQTSQVLAEAFSKFFRHSMQERPVERLPPACRSFSLDRSRLGAASATISSQPIELELIASLPNGDIMSNDASSNRQSLDRLMPHVLKGLHTPKSHQSQEDIASMLRINSTAAGDSQSKKRADARSHSRQTRSDAPPRHRAPSRAGAEHTAAAEALGADKGESSDYSDWGHARVQTSAFWERGKTRATHSGSAPLGPHSLPPSGKHAPKRPSVHVRRSMSAHFRSAQHLPPMADDRAAFGWQRCSFASEDRAWTKHPLESQGVAADPEVQTFEAMMAKRAALFNGTSR